MTKCWNRRVRRRLTRFAASSACGRNRENLRRASVLTLAAICLLAMVVSGETEVDHILPFSKTLDNSMANKVVCIAAATATRATARLMRRSATALQGYDYQRILEVTAKFPANKRWRFRQEAMERFDEESIFLDRQLNETRYLSRTARAYLAHLYDEKGEGRRYVMATPGHLTSLLRRAWGLEGMLRGAPDTGETVPKQRDDHRHHAIDAFVVANTTEGLLQQFAPRRCIQPIISPWKGCATWRRILGRVSA